MRFIIVLALLVAIVACAEQHKDAPAPTADSAKPEIKEQKNDQQTTKPVEGGKATVGRDNTESKSDKAKTGLKNAGVQLTKEASLVLLPISVLLARLF